MSQSIAAPAANGTALSKPKDVKGWIQSDVFREQVAQALPTHMTPDRFIRVALTSLMKTPKLVECSQNSIFKCMLDCSSLGLEPDGRRAHLIPYFNKKIGCMEASLIIDYKGLIELAKRSGEVKSWRAEIVCAADGFSWDNGVITHKIDFLKPRGEALAVYSHVRNSNGDDEYEVMTFEQVEKIRERSKSGNDGPWKTDFNEMAKKTVIRRHSKRLTLSPEFMEALEKDDDHLLATLDKPNFDAMMPQRMSEAKPQETFEVDAGALTQPDPMTSQESPPVEPPLNPDAQISHVRLAELMRGMEIHGVSKEQLVSYLKQLGLKSPQDLKNKQYQDALIFLETVNEDMPGAEG